VSYLCLSIGPTNLEVDGLLKVDSFVFFGPHSFDVLDEHHEVNYPRHLMRRDQVEINMEIIVVNSLTHMVVGVVVENGKIAIGIFNDLETTLVVNIGSVRESGARLEMVDHVSVVLLPIKDAAQSIRRDP
jgi:hypothetical protein